MVLSSWRRLFFPEAWEQSVELIPMAERHEMISAYYRRLISDDQHMRSHVARA
ncbi:hypothetical protein APA_2830 [Pseudanabaena sp. lw0831]|uniref:hypothetical protein n=1 Tax=Pseudanabaena sp. lw0831 TaxID=1357935 RepID=UPI0019169637|nr:hypothetical protein [Pseudanabaena sp. lw0831]GBO54779.1 hypothetical protein APA_2830 [Pseudanabaena sp. lw0831]